MSAGDRLLLRRLQSAQAPVDSSLQVMRSGSGPFGHSSSGVLLLHENRSSKERSSGQEAQGVKSGAATMITGGGHHNNNNNLRGESTDVSSLPKSLPKSGSEMEAADQQPYVPVKLTKEVLFAFEEQTRTSSHALIETYLERCRLEPGEKDGLISPDSSGDSSRTSSEGSE